jgi:hypothetical protein
VWEHAAFVVSEGRRLLSSHRVLKPRKIIIEKR